VHDSLLFRNRILAALDGNELALHARHLRPVVLNAGCVLIAPDTPIKHAYFLTDGMACIFTTTKSGQTVQNDLVGREGFVGVPLILGYDRIVNSTVLMQIAGRAFKIDAALFQAASNQPGKLQLLLRRYAHSQLIRVMQTSVCNRVHSMEERLASWLLMVSDRVGPEFRATHDVMAEMLGSRRVTLTLRAHELQRAGIIQYTYGRLRILNRTRLERRACECYNTLRDEFDAFLRC
jgi:CRP-like cAMP-binding protein